MLVFLLYETTTQGKFGVTKEARNMGHWGLNVQLRCLQKVHTFVPPQNAIRTSKNPGLFKNCFN